MSEIQFTKTTETAAKDPFVANLETLPGGVCLAVTDLVNTTILAGTPVGLDSNTGLYHVCKTAELQANATDSAVSYRVLKGTATKGHNLKVGDFVSSNLLKPAYAITAIDTTETDYDLITLGTTLGEALTDGDVLIAVTAEATGNTSAWKYTPVGLTGSNVEVVSGANHFVDVIVRGSVKESLIPPIHSAIKTVLNLFRFV